MKVQVPESKIQMVISLFKQATGGEVPEYFVEALIAGNAFKKEGLTPMYFYDEDENAFTITSEEHFEKKLN